MNTFIVILLVLICVLLVIIAVAMLTLFRMPPNSRDLTEETRERFNAVLRRESDEFLDEQYVEHRSPQPPYQPKITNPILGWTGGDDRIHTKNPKGADILIPEHLSEEDKQLLKDFYNL